MSERVVKLLPLTEFTVVPPTAKSITTNGHDFLGSDDGNLRNPTI